MSPRRTTARSNYRSDWLLEPPSAPRWLPPYVEDESWVYLHIGADSECLYIGKTGNGPARDRAHAKGSEWYSKVDRIVWFGPMTPLNAGAAERELITAVQPANNVRHTERDPILNISPKLRVKRAEERCMSLVRQLEVAERTLERAEKALKASQVSA